MTIPASPPPASSRRRSAGPARPCRGRERRCPARARHRAQWSTLFGSFDVVLAPPYGTAAFPHDDNPDQTKRRLMIDGQATNFLDQLSWPGTAAFPGLPSTCAPIAATAEGLPIGVQIIGPRFEDRTTIAFAGLLEREVGRV